MRNPKGLSESRLLIVNLKKEAPTVYQQFKTKRLQEYRLKLESLKQKYEFTKDNQEKNEILEEAKIVKSDLTFLESLDKED